MENGNLGLFDANEKRKWQTSVCLLLKEMENGSKFFLVSKRLTVINDFCFSKCLSMVWYCNI
jgi:hypothetical protein